ncbi:acyltransferase family protein [Blautia sp.]|uniref:acyltransferase family protein n=1 Tax=Blautia sp. TaxID=1955243 RepID=UPI003AB2042B
MKTVNFKDTRIEYLDVLRGIAIILMIMGHIGFGYIFDKYIHVFHMPIWFFISGWFFKVKENEKIGKLIIKYAKSLLVPYVIWGILQYPIWLLLCRTPEDDIWEPLRNLFWMNTNLIMPIAGALWFLTCLFFAQVFFSILLRKIKNTLIIIMIVVFISTCGCYWNRFASFRLPWALDTAFVALGFVALGYYLHQEMKRKIVQKAFNLTLPICVIAFSINGILGLLNGYVNMRVGTYGIVTVFWFNAIIAILVYWNGSRLLYQYMEVRKHKGLNWIQEIGKNSIVYLCLNQLVILVLSKILVALGFSDIPLGIRGVILLFITLPILYKIEKIFINSCAKILFGK